MVDIASTRDRRRLTRESAGAPIRGRVWLLSAFLFVAFFGIEHDLKLLGRQVGSVHENVIVDDYVEATAGGNRFRQLGYLALAGVGLLFLFEDRGRRWDPQWLLVAAIAAIAVWSAASITWSIDPPLSLRRWVVAICCLVGAVGLARGVTARELGLITILSALALVVLSFTMDVAVGSRPWAAGYRFGGTLHPNITACYCGLVCLAAFSLARDARQPLVYWGAFVVALLLLVLTRSRTAAAALMVALFVIWIMGRPRLERWCYLSAIATAGGGLLLFLGAADRAVRDRVLSTVLMGRHEEARTLTGRIPLWQELMDYADDRWYQGYGYSSFWSTAHIEEVFESQLWAISSAHSAYLELILTIGVIGMLLVTAAALLGAWCANRRLQETMSSGYAFVLGAIAFGLANGLLESLFVETRYPTFLALCGWCMAGLYSLHEREQPGQVDDAPLASVGEPPWRRLHPQLSRRLDGSRFPTPPG